MSCADNKQHGRHYLYLAGLSGCVYYHVYGRERQICMQVLSYNGRCVWCMVFQINKHISFRHNPYYYSSAHHMTGSEAEHLQVFQYSRLKKTW